MKYGQYGTIRYCQFGKAEPLQSPSIIHAQHITLVFPGSHRLEDGNTLALETESTPQFESKNRSVLSSASLYDVTDKRTISVQGYRCFDTTQRLFVHLRLCISCSTSNKKGMSYDQTTTVSFWGDLRADAVGGGVDFEGSEGRRLWL